MPRIRPAVALAVLFLVPACAQPQVDQASLVRVLSVLADDSLRGRAAFSPDAMRAADFLADEFAAIGLEPPAGQEGYLQRFAVYSVTADSVAVMLNGRPVDPANAAVSVSAAGIDWTQETGPAPTLVGRDGNLMDAWRSARGTDALIVADPAHAESFARIRGFLARGSRSTTREGGSSTAIVLAAGPVTSYAVRATARTAETPLANVVGTIPGRRADEIVLFSAHYDHIGIVRPVEGDSIGNGANDDASGTAAVVELARYFKAAGRPERTLLFAAFTAEESGGYGSRHFSEQLDPDRIVAMFNIEMIGKPAVEGPNTAWITGWDRSDFGPILAAAVEGTEFRFYADPYPEQNLFYRSDNATLARLGVPAHSISTTPIDVDTDYHQVSDEVGTLDLEHLAATVRAIAAGARTIVSGEATPTRVAPETLER